MEIFKSILMLLGGLGVFLIGLKVMGDNLESLAGDKLKKLFNKISNNRFAGVAIGAGVTAVIQSSSATTVMIIGFVNAGVMTLIQATSIIMGANIGTTVTALIVSLQSLPITAFFAALACVGAFMQMSKKDTVASIGAILSGIGMIFIGLDVMSKAMAFIQDMPIIQEFLTSITNPFLLLFIGLVLTALIQSSSATTGILLTLCGQNPDLLTLKSCIFIVLGINIGTCITAILASIGANTNAKRASLVHLLFNFFGTIVFFTIACLSPMYKLFEKMSPNNIQFQISLFHLLFNLTTTALLLPFVKQLAQLATIIIRDKKPKEGAIDVSAEPYKLQYVDNRLLATPSIAILMLRKEIITMSGLAKQNLDLAMTAITTDILSPEDDEKFATTEKNIDYLNGRLTKFIVEISTERISYINEKELATYYHVLSDIERIGDYAENIIEYAKEISEISSKFSEKAKSEIKDMQDIVYQLYDNIIVAFSSKDMSKEKEIWTLEDLVDKMQYALEKEHIERLRKQECSADAGSIFLSLISNIERIADHMMNIFKSMKSYVHLPSKQPATIKGVGASGGSTKQSNTQKLANTQKYENLPTKIDSTQNSNTEPTLTDTIALNPQENVSVQIDDITAPTDQKSTQKKTSKVCAKKNKK